MSDLLQSFDRFFSGEKPYNSGGGAFGQQIGNESYRVIYAGSQREALRERIEQLEAQINQAFSMLSAYGVPKERARSVANGIDVLATRYRKADDATGAQLANDREIAMLYDRLFHAARGVCIDVDWNNGTHAKAYRQKLVDAVAAIAASKEKP